jgi:hypothetical protein
LAQRQAPEIKKIEEINAQGLPLKYFY